MTTSASQLLVRRNGRIYTIFSSGSSWLLQDIKWSIRKRKRPAGAPSGILHTVPVGSGRNLPRYVPSVREDIYSESSGCARGRGPSAPPVVPGKSPSRRPSDGCSNPASRLISVVFPQPMGPTRQTNSPAVMSMSTWESTVCSSPLAERKLFATPPIWYLC